MFKGDPQEYFQSSHWDEPNVLAHTRLKDRIDKDGKRHLFVEEIQSDWHRQGYEKGYASESKKGLLGEVKQDEITKKTNKNGQTVFNFKRDLGNRIVEHSYVPDEQKNLDKAKEEALSAIQNWAEERDRIYTRYTPEDNTVPDAPFKKTWHEFVSKNLLNDAAKGGYDNISWTTGAQQSARYKGTGTKYKKLVYDEKIPQFMKSVGKKYGVQPEKVNK